MKPREDRRPEADRPAATRTAGRGPSSREVRETSWQAIGGLWRVFIMIVAACLGAATVEAVRAIFF